MRSGPAATLRAASATWLLALAAAGRPPPRAGEDPAGAVAARGVGALGGLPLALVENAGQVAGDAAFVSIGGDAAIEFAAGNVRYTQFASASAGGGPSVLTLEFVGAAAAAPVGERVLPTVVHCYPGAPERRRTGLRTFARVVYRDLWPGIDLAFEGRLERLKHEFVVRPGADASRIRLRWRGASSVTVAPDGAMVVGAGATSLRDERPVSYEEADGARRDVASRYVVRDAGEGGTEYGFELGARDPARTLVIDPVQIVYATYVGTSYDDRGLGVAVDAAGAAYVTGRISSVATMSYDAYVVKVAPDGGSFVWLTTIGGEGRDEGYDVAVDRDGAAYVVGPATSDDFPTPHGADGTFGGGESDAYVAKLTPTGELAYASFIGGAGTDFAEGVAVDDKGDVVVEGPTNSTGATLGTRVGPDLTENGGFDVFVAKLAADGSRFLYLGFIGGGGEDVGRRKGVITSGHVAVDREGAAYVSGMTNSTETTFPGGTGFGTLPSWDRTHHGGYDAFVVKVKPDGAGLAWAGYLGGTGDDRGFGMAVDAEGNAYLTGEVESSEATFPTGKGFGDLPGRVHTYAGGVDAFLASVAADGTKLRWVSYLGGSKLDYGQAVALDPSGDLWVAGHVESPDFPVLDGPDLTFNGPATDGDAFVARWTRDGSKLLSSGFLGGAGDDHAFWLAIDHAGAVYVVGDTPSNEATFPDGNGMASRRGKDRTHHGRTDAFLVKLAK